MKYITKLKLATIHKYCDIEEKSTEYTIQFMQDVANIDLDIINKYFLLGSKNHKILQKEVFDFLELFEQLN
jgi:hypothetical protein